MRAMRTNLDRYVSEICQYSLLSRDQELALAHRFREQGDLAAAHDLFVANLRFVVKLANDYRSYGLKVLDLIQEGNIGLMMAVRKFDPNRGCRLISYAAWWIRAYMHRFVLQMWSSVRIGTTQRARKLFFKLRSTRSRLTQQAVGEAPSIEQLAEALGVPERDVLEMEARLAAKDCSLDARIDDTSTTLHIDVLQSPGDNQEEQLAELESQRHLARAVQSSLEKLNTRERSVVEQRILNSEQKTLREIGGALGVSCERVRQIERAALGKLRTMLRRERFAGGASP
jgi:RNA polymerase sigma-32 factor